MGVVYSELGILKTFIIFKIKHAKYIALSEYIELRNFWLKPLFIKSPFLDKFIEYTRKYRHKTIKLDSKKHYYTL